MNRLPASISAIPGLPDIATRCQHIDVKTYRGAGRMDAFIAGFMGYHPAWLKGLYAIRWGFVRLLGMKQERVPEMGKRARPEDVPMRAGEKAAFFTVKAAEPERYWLVYATDKHLTAYLCITAGRDGGGQMFNVATLVEYHNWAGPVYFNVIRPFHHLVVGQMSQAGLRASTA